MLCHNGRILLYCNSHEKCFLFVISHTYFFLDERPAWCNLTPDASGFHLLIHTLFCKCVRSQKECERFLRGRMSRVARSDQISGFWGYKLSQDKCKKRDSSFLILDELDLNLNSRFTCYLFFWIMYINCFPCFLLSYPVNHLLSSQILFWGRGL